MGDIVLRHYQAESTPAIEEYLAEHPGKNPLVALPTGSGKTYCIADLVRHCHNIGVGVLVLSHVKEILEQNHKSIEKFTGLDIALNSSGLGRREIGDVTVAGIQSVYRNADQFKHVGVLIIDEAHRVNPDEETMYKRFLNDFPSNVPCIGFTATPFRLGSGYIYGDTDDTIFDSLVLDWCTKEKFNQLVEEGYLCKLTTKRTELEMDTSGIKLLGGDFSEKQLAERFDRTNVTNAAIKEILAAGATRKKWLIFAIDIDHAEHIAEMLIRNGIPTAPVHSKMGEAGFDRDGSIEGFKNGRYKCVVNVNILTTGFDDPGIDLIALLRPTSSPVLHVQTLGRGSRIEEDKSDCLVLDFAGNTARLGPINDVLVLKKKKGGEGGDPITKTCPTCQSILPPAVRICPDCKHVFVFEHGLNAKASNIDVMEDGREHWVPVAKVKYEAVRKVGTPNSVKVTYHCGNQKINEWICVEHKGFAKHKAMHWLKFRGGDSCDTVDGFLEQADKLSVPSEILVQKKGKYYIIKEANF
jgi:DNA repair protein RadD